MPPKREEASFYPPPVANPIPEAPLAMAIRDSRRHPVPSPIFSSGTYTADGITLPTNKTPPSKSSPGSPARSDKTEHIDIDPIEYREAAALEGTIPAEYIAAARTVLGPNASRFAVLFRAAKESISQNSLRRFHHEATPSMMQTELVRIARDNSETVNALRMENDMLKRQYENMKGRLEGMWMADVMGMGNPAGQKRARS